MSAKFEREKPLTEPAPLRKSEASLYVPFTCADVTPMDATPYHADVKKMENIIRTYQARILIANEYLKFHKDYYDGISPKEEERLRTQVFENLCQDEYSNPERSRTLVALDTYGNIAGTLRFVFGKVTAEGKEENTPPIETMKLMQSDAGTSWPAQRDGMIAEVGRIAVSHDQRPHNTASIIHCLMEKAFEEARVHNISEINVVMPTKPPHKLLNAFQNAGLKPKLINGVSVRTDPEAKSVTDTFPGYWTLDPRLHTLEVPPVKAA